MNSEHFEDTHKGQKRDSTPHHMRHFGPPGGYGGLGVGGGSVLGLSPGAPMVSILRVNAATGYYGNLVLRCCMCWGTEGKLSALALKPPTVLVCD